jgi:NADH:ubiquinone oxidoreductase subunit 6 (subunit J)
VLVSYVFFIAVGEFAVVAAEVFVVLVFAVWYAEFFLIAIFIEVACHFF